MAKTKEQRARVFVSYSRTDGKFAEKLREQLTQADLSTWLDVESLRPGTEWQPALEEALRGASALVVCLSPKSTQSSFVTFEWSYALGAGIKVFPVLVEETPMHPFLARYQWIDLSSNNPPWEQLIDALKKVPRARTAPPLQREKTRPSRRPARAGKGPQLRAAFEIDGGKPVKFGNEYCIQLSIKNVPAGTPFVTYELHDKSFAEPQFKIPATERDFGGWISSYGDVRISARGKNGRKNWKTGEWLGDALQREYGTRASDAIKRALEDIKAN